MNKTIVIVGVLVIIGAAAAAFLYFNQKPAFTNLTNEVPIIVTPIQRYKGADLTINSITIYPSQPTSGQFFEITVQVTNIGDLKSGKYKVFIQVKEAGSSTTYAPVIISENLGLEPGYSLAVSHSRAMVNFPGSYIVTADIREIDFADSNMNNNVGTLLFTAK